MKLKVKIVLILVNVTCVNKYCLGLKIESMRLAVNKYCLELENVSRVKIWVKSCYLVQINFAFY